MNKTCDKVDEIILFSLSLRNQTFDSENGIVNGILFLFSLTILIFGRRIFPFIVLFSAFVVVSLLTFMFLKNSELECFMILIGSAICGLTFAVCICSLYKVLLFLISVISMVSFVHTTFAIFPSLHTIEYIPTIMERSVIYWSLIAFSFLISFIVVKKASDLVIEILTSVIGGIGLAYSSYVFQKMLNGNLHKYVFFCIGIVTSCIGTMLQRQLRLRKQMKEKKINE